MERKMRKCAASVHKVFGVAHAAAISTLCLGQMHLSDRCSYVHSIWRKIKWSQRSSSKRPLKSAEDNQKHFPFKYRLTQFRFFIWKNEGHFEWTLYSWRVLSVSYKTSSGPSWICPPAQLSHGTDGEERMCPTRGEGLGLGSGKYHISLCFPP